MYELFNQISQIGIMILGTLSIILITTKDKRKRYIGSWFGLISQIFWFYTSFYNNQYGIIFVAFIYTFSWIMGIKNNKG